MAIPFSGSFDASFVRRCAYSRALIPGVTKACIRVSLTHCYRGNHTYALQASANVDGFRALAAQIGGRQQRLQRTIATVAVQVSKKQG